MIDVLLEEKQILLLGIFKRFIQDNVATANDLQAIRKACEEYIRGETVSISNIEFNLVSGEGIASLSVLLLVMFCEAL